MYGQPLPTPEDVKRFFDKCRKEYPEKSEGFDRLEADRLQKLAALLEALEEEQ